MVYHTERMRFGSFIAPYHAIGEDPTLCLERDMQLVEHLDALNYDEAWIGEHHSGGFETISSPEMFIAGVAPRTRNIRFGTGVNSLTYHHPLILADRIVQLDHQTRGRLMFGAGPGQLPTDAFMMGIDPMQQRRMMNESLECIIDLFEGRTVSRTTDWFTLNDARLQMRPYQSPRMEMAVACAITPTGPSTAGRLGLGMLSLAASTTIGFTALGDHWGVYEETAKRHNKSVSRDSWRVVVNMHIAETREQAMADLEWGAMDLVGYIRAIRGKAANDGAPIDAVQNASERRQADDHPGHEHLRRRHGGHTAGCNRPRRKAAGAIRGLWHLHVPGPQLRRLRRHQEELRAVRAACDPSHPEQKSKPGRVDDVGERSERHDLQRHRRGHEAGDRRL